MTTEGPTPTGAEAPQVSLVGEVLDRRYRILKKLGEGGMGEVYAAEHVHIAKRVAVKLLRQEIVSNKEAVDRFYQEAKSASSIGHRNIIGIEDFGQLPDGRIYMCMELLDGAPLNDLLKQPLTMDRLLNILIQTGHGLAAAHAKGITHRDMKPENIYVTHGPDGSDVPKLLDFGIAKVAGNDGQNNLTRTGTIFGTPYYMAPEQALGQGVDARADVYAVGVIMYEVFSGSLPFQGESFMGILTQHITTEPEPVVARAAKAGRQLPPELADIISRAMAKDPARRYQSMDELVTALVGFYRQVAGAGMSTYMAAFPVPMSGQVPAQPSMPSTPQASIPTIMGASVPGHVTPVPHHPTPPPMAPASRPVPMMSPGSGVEGASSSSMAYQPKQGSKVGLILLIVAVLGAGGAVAAFFLLKKPAKKEPEVATGSNTTGSNTTGSGSGSAAVAMTTPDAAPATGSGSAGGGSGSAVVATTTPDAAPAEIPVVIDAGVPVTAKIDAGTPTPTPAVELSVAINVKPHNAKIFEGRTLVGKAAAVLKVTAGTKRTLLLRAPGFKDQTIEIDGSQDNLAISLEKIERVDPLPEPDCSRRLLRPRDAKCVKQYCRHNPSDTDCLE